MKINLLLIIFLGLYVIFCSNSNGQVLEQDSLALVALYDSTDGANWVNNENWLTTEPVSNWYGIVTKAGRVTEIELFNNNLVGIIPNEINALDGLTSLSVGRNQLSGEIPREIFELTELIYLFIDHNEFEGKIPSEISNLTNLKKLNLGKNQLTGEIPTELYTLTNLTYFEVYSNQLRGEIPPELANLTNMETLSLSNNQFTGEIFTYIVNMVKLRMLFLPNNFFSGSIPSSVENLTQLYHFNAGGNEFNGNIPPEIGNLTNLYFLNLGDNKFTGSIPQEIGDLINLETLYLYRNEITGSIPSRLGDLLNLKKLYLSENELSDEVPNELSNLSNLEQLYLKDNLLTGVFPLALTSLTNLERLYLDRNQFHGTIPEEITNLTKLKDLQLFDNQFVDLPDISSMPLIEELEIQNNKFTFEDIEPNINTLYFSYSPQDSVGEKIDTILTPGQTITISVDVGGTANVYQWLKDGVDISDATETSYTIDSADASDVGLYTCEISNTIVPDLILYSNNMQVTVDGAVDVEKIESNIPTKFALFQNYPNPFNPSTTIKYSIPYSSVISNPQRDERSEDHNRSEIYPSGRNDNVYVSLKVYDILGREVTTLVNQNQKPGNYEVDFEGKDLTSGIYFYKISAGKYIETKKMILLR